MKIWQIFTLLLLTAVIFGCVPRATINPVDRIPFPEDEYKALSSSGTAIVRGQAFLKTRGGEVKTAAGEEVYLNPITTYSKQWYEVSYSRGIPLKSYDPRLEKYCLTQIADGNGRFNFKNVPAGDYYLTTRVIWEAPVGYRGALVPQGGFVLKTITVKDGEELDVILTR